MSSKHHVYVLDDDDSVRESLGWTLKANGLDCTLYASAEEFLAEVSVDCPSCLILDLQLGNSDGMMVQRYVTQQTRLSMPVIILSATATVAHAVECTKRGAVDVLEKPADPSILLERVRQALERHGEIRQRRSEQSVIDKRVGTLTDREREVLGLLCQGKSSKEMASALKISQKTIAIHRGHVLRKLDASSSTDAVRLAMHHIGGA
jgi:FixJ family two-component response regulator